LTLVSEQRSGEPEIARASLTDRVQQETLTTHQEEFSVLIPAQIKSLNETQPASPGTLTPDPKYRVDRLTLMSELGQKRKGSF
jgi:hypothetical protein